MNTVEALRALADEIEKREALEKLVEQLRAELAARPQELQKEEAEWLSPKDAAVYIGRSVTFLNKDRIEKVPRIPFRKDSTRAVRYRKSDLDAFTKSARRK